MAQRAGVQPAVISAYERNLRDPTIGTLQRLLEAVGMTLTGQLAPSDAGLDAAVRAALEQSPVERPGWRSVSGAGGTWSMPSRRAPATRSRGCGDRITDAEAAEVLRRTREILGTRAPAGPAAGRAT